MHLSHYISILLSVLSFVSALPLQNDAKSDEASELIHTAVVTSADNIATPEDVDKRFYYHGYKRSAETPEDVDKRFYYHGYKRSTETPEDVDKRFFYHGYKRSTETPEDVNKRFYYHGYKRSSDTPEDLGQ
ncbi:hypothetical protein BDV38DRAFT_276935 [Aspergillus pseudotamarii]|uniref:Uncharacterized protein n=1 Tax=Aspergillus pseudotamarii TaxID=132259 RepID=A0A5N6TC35_ASPPS|nr:uncharacterized protein BDV38DRAFT_276935 [Aspergillus pseudotamarii]KAE8143866.1 hypothetical protein BDV38DRAFT_276935 [Aspergillus pseudotamarii]